MNLVGVLLLVLCGLLLRASVTDERQRGMKLTVELADCQLNY